MNIWNDITGIEEAQVKAVAKNVGEPSKSIGPYVMVDFRDPTGKLPAHSQTCLTIEQAQKLYRDLGTAIEEHGSDPSGTIDNSDEGR